MESTTIAEAVREATDDVSDPVYRLLTACMMRRRWFPQSACPWVESIEPCVAL